MNKLLIFAILLFGHLANGQPATTANDAVPTYTTPTRIAVNPGYHGNHWDDMDLANFAAGNPSQNIEGAGMKALRATLPEDFLETYGYSNWIPTYQHYQSVGLLDNTVFLQNPSPDHRDPEEYCTGSQSLLFKNMYAPIWDNGENGTPVNDTNYYALYVYKTVDLYKNYVKFWEIWNEPDFDFSGAGWLPPGQPGNWWENVPDPCDYQLQAPVYHYIRLLRISYEVIKTVDPDAFVAVGGLGYESFLDICLRFTDNPVDGSVTADYPLKGGAYFDCLSFHSYPHFNGSLRYWDNTCGCFVYTRHSDAAADGIINHKNSFETVLTTHGYDGVTYPQKVTIITETNVPNKQFVDYIGSYEAQRNFGMKMMIYSYQNDIRHLALYQLADTKSYNQASNWFEVCGLYKKINSPPYNNIQKNEEGIGTLTTSNIIFETTYDETKTHAMSLPSNIEGAAFQKSSGEYIYVLWAKTETDQSETASGTYSFPASFGITSLDKMEWDFSQTGTIVNIAPTSVALTGAPTFFEESIAPLPVELLNFTAQPVDAQVILNWATASEENNQGFEIQYSKDGEIWENLTFIIGAGFSTIKNDYEYRHDSPRLGWNYYRLKQIDFDEKFSYSPIESVEFRSDENTAPKIFPNPTGCELTITNFAGEGYFYSMDGKLLLQLTNHALPADQVDIHQLPIGMYHLALVNKRGERTNMLLIKQK